MEKRKALWIMLAALAGMCWSRERDFRSCRERVMDHVNAQRRVPMLNMKLINRGTEGELLLAGQLDTVSAADAERILLDTVGRFDTLILDLGQLRYISSAGLNVLRRAHFTMRQKGGALAFCHVSEPVMEVFEITGFAGILKII